MKFYNDVLELIGNTPLVKINHLTKQHGIKAQVLAKMESLNPGYSVKDRIGRSMIDWAEREGVLKKGGTIIEATSGNTGIGLALTAAVRGYKCIFVLTDKASVEKVRYLKGLGADVVVVPASAKPGTPEHYHETARRIYKETPNSFYPDQYSHPANPAAHYSSTGPEIWRRYRRTDHSFCSRHWNRRNDHRNGPISQGDESKDKDHRRRPVRFDL